MIVIDKPKKKAKTRFLNQNLILQCINENERQNCLGKQIIDKHRLNFKSRNFEFEFFGK